MKLDMLFQYPQVWYRGGFKNCKIDYAGNIWVENKKVGVATEEDLKQSGEYCLYRGGIGRNFNLARNNYE